MNLNDFDKLVQIQVEIADQILSIENEIQYYEQLEKEMVIKRERELHKSILGYKGDKTETEFAIHYIQVKLQQKKELFSHLTKAFRHRSEEYLQPSCSSF
ncbi:hypothetical protein BKP35_07245 [Anaerobacillus arseniciselenatis]|uniref:Uncharacterized protein n=1 Tax=Anaerobacillus arseniciselenatis TaxID=85682 RepID=A0A1S2LNS9_9BACI|nr:hypothetical protein [Anaerobacillus arseniciselenatis]OIJ13994.1 hypothetical protein BKP35_07245 [Anaerobacillus arseniciselenatis]